MINLNILETFRTKEELINYFEEKGQSITEEEIDNLKKSYEQAEENKDTLSLKELDGVSGGIIDVYIAPFNRLLYAVARASCPGNLLFLKDINSKGAVAIKHNNILYGAILCSELPPGEDENGKTRFHIGFGLKEITEKTGKTATDLQNLNPNLRDETNDPMLRIVNRGEELTPDIIVDTLLDEAFVHVTSKEFKTFNEGLYEKFKAFVGDGKNLELGHVEGNASERDIEGEKNIGPNFVAWFNNRGDNIVMPENTYENRVNEMLKKIHAVCE